MAGPKRELFKASDVCAMAQLQPYVLRTWETEFPGLGHVPTKGGPRLYRRSDVEKVLKIRQLVFSEGLTLAGARRRLDEEAEEPSTPSLEDLAVDDVLDTLGRQRLRGIRDGLQEILALLNRDVATPGTRELRLVPPDESAAVRGRSSGARARRPRSSGSAG